MIELAGDETCLTFKTESLYLRYSHYARKFVGNLSKIEPQLTARNLACPRYSYAWLADFLINERRQYLEA